MAKKKKKSPPKLIATGDPVLDWLRGQGAVESIKFDEDTGRPMTCFTLPLNKKE